MLNQLITLQVFTTEHMLHTSWSTFVRYEHYYISVPLASLV